MSTPLDYLRWRGDLPINHAHPFNSVDAALFASLVYLPIDASANGHNLAEAAQRLKHEADFQAQIRAETDSEIELLPHSPRFGKINILDWTNRLEKDPLPLQFNAATFRLDKSTILVAYRGTDTSMIGWNEDFNMNYMPEIYGQTVAAKYLKTIAKKFPNDQIYLTGHSKGGNFALYALSVMPIATQNRIIKAFNFDGPGFYYQIANQPGFKQALPKMKTYIPEKSGIGTMLDHPERTLIVKSVFSSLLQHDPRRWSVGRDSFVLAKELAPESRIFRHALIHFNHSIPRKKRRLVFPALFNAFENDDITDLSQLGTNKLTSAYRLSRVFLALDPSIRQVFTAMLGDILTSYRQNLNLPFIDSRYRNYPASNDSSKAPIFFEFYDPHFYPKDHPHRKPTDD